MYYTLCNTSYKKTTGYTRNIFKFSSFFGGYFFSVNYLDLFHAFVLLKQGGHARPYGGMKGIVCLLLLSCIASLSAATTVTIHGDAITAGYALVLKGDATSITLSSDGTITHTAIKLPLAGSWALESKLVDRAHLYASLTSKRVQTLTLLHPKFSLRTISDNGGMAGISAQGGPLSVALFSFPLPDDISLLSNEREGWAGVAVLARLQAKAPFATVDWEVGYSARRALSATTTLSVEVGPFVLTERFGPSSGEREIELAFSAKGGGVSCSLSHRAALGPDAIYSGEQQEKRTLLTSSFSLSFASVTLESGSEFERRLEADGKEVHAHVVTLGLSVFGLRCALRWRVNSAPTYAFSASSSRITLSKEHISASFLHSEGPWQFTLQFSKEGVLSLLWRYTITMSRGSGSPRPS